MANTVKQPSYNPTNKLTAAVLGAAVVEIAQIALANLAPTWTTPALWNALTPVIILACGWFVPDRPNIMVVVEESKEEPENG